MNVTDQEGQPKVLGAESRGDSAKLLSLLALAMGAVAMPQSSNADIIFTDLSANPAYVGPQTNHNFVISNLPGSAQIGFHVNSLAGLRFITGKQEAGYVRLKTAASFIVPMAGGKAWNTVGGNASSNGFVAAANAATTQPDPDHPINNQYFLFSFRDSTQAGTPLRYGWLEISIANSPTDLSNPLLTIEGYAYDTTGAFLGSGQVPEPSAAALLALGAMALGAKGLRSWRKNRQSA